MAAPAAPIAAPRVLRVSAGALALAGLVAAGVAICVTAAAAPSGLIPSSWQGMPGWLRGPLPAVGDGLTGGEFSGLFVVMGACSLAARAARLAARQTGAFSVALPAAFLPAPPLLSSDVFGYIDWARLGVVHGLDPYAH